ncbi:MAG: hypothetical protein R6T91_03675 [Bacteroidales bacterium]
MKSKITVILKRFLLLAILPGLLVISCKKDAQPWWEVDWYGPAAHGTINLSNLIEDSLMNSSNQKVWLSLDRNIFALETDSLLKLPDDVERTSYKLQFPLTINPGNPIFDLDKTRPLQAGDAEITKAYLKYGKIKVQTKTTYDQPMEYTYQFPGITRNGQPFTIKNTVEGTPSGTITKDHEYELVDYEIDLTGKNHDRFNRIHYNVRARTTDYADTMTITIQDSFALMFTFEDIELYGIEGYFGQKDIHFSDTSNIQLFNQIQSGVMDIDSINAHLNITNGMGADLQLKVNKFSSINKNSHHEEDLQASFIGSTINLGRAIKNPGIQSTTKNLDLSSSNIDALIENIPDRLSYDMEMKINPMGNVSMGNDFYYNSNQLNVQLLMHIPLKLSLSNLRFQDTLDVDLNEDTEPLNSAELQIHFTNYFPLEATVDLFAPSSSGNLKISTEVNTLESASINSQGIVTTPQESVIQIVLNQEILDAIRHNGKLLMDIHLNTDNQQMIEIYEDYKIDYQVRGQVSIRINEK